MPKQDKNLYGISPPDNFFRKVLENSYSGITLLNVAWEIIYRSPSAKRINGWTNFNRTKNTLQDITHPEDWPLLEKLLTRVLESPGSPLTFTFRSLHFNGHYIWLQCTFTNLLDDSDIKAIVCNFIDITHSKRAEQILRDTVEELSSYKYALDESAIIAITDQKGIILHANNNFCKISGYSQEELTGQDHRIISSGYHDKDYIRNLWRTIAQGGIWKGEFKNKAKDGSNYWVDTTIIPFLNIEGKPYQYLSIRTDITQRKLAEIELEKKNTNLMLLDSVIRNTSDVVLITEAEPFDEPGPRIVYVNEAFTRMTGYAPGDAIGRSPRFLQGPRSDSNELKRLSSCIRDFKPCEITVINYKKSGEEFWSNMSVSPATDDKGNYTHFIAIQRDITPQKKDELNRLMMLEALAETLEEKNTILESIGDGFFTANHEWTVTYWNYMAEKLLQKRKSDILNYNLWEVFAGMEDSISYKNYHLAVKTGKAIRFEDYYEPLGKWYDISAYPSGNGLSVYFKDVTEKRLYIEAIEDQNEKLKEISWIQSHVVRAPLARIMGLIPLITDSTEQSAEVKTEMLQHLQTSANDLDEVIKTITDKSRVSDFQLPPKQ